MKSNIHKRNRESGAALPAVLFVSSLLLVGSAFLLSSVGYQSQNATDVLNETKAYYAAESGLQASINVLRFKNVQYSKAIANPKLKWDAVNFPEGMVYATDTDGIEKINLDSDAKYSVLVYNPDESRQYIFQTQGYFETAAGVTIKNNGKTLCAPAARCTPGLESEPRTEVTFTDRPSTTVPSFTTNYSLGQISVANFGAGAAIPAGVKFKIEYQLTSPRSASRTIRGETLASAALSPVSLKFLTQKYTLVGSGIELCSQSTPESPGTTGNVCTNFTSLSATSSTALTIYANLSPVEPYRMVVRSTGYGPNRSRKILESVFQRNFFDDLASSSAIALIGPAPGMTFDAGTGGPIYCGVDLGYEPGDPIPNTPPCVVDPNVATGPSIGVTDPNALGTVTSGGSRATLTPPPDVISDLPEWQQSPAQLDAFVSDYRNYAINAGTYYGSVGGTTNLTSIGNFNTGLGITVCEGNCNVGPISGGGILIVTGTFNYNGNFSFNGLIVVTGPGGMHRNGGGGGQIVGNIVIAPYNPADLNAGFLPPRFSTNGGGNSDILFGGTSTAFDGTNAVTNIVLGIAEK